MPLAPCGASQFLSEFANNGRLGFLSINDVVNELKQIRVRGRSLHRHNADALVSDDNFVAFFNVEEFNGSRAAFFPVNCDCAVHHRGRHLDLLTVEANKRLLVGRYVELGRENAVGWSRGKLVRLLRSVDFGAVLSKPQDQFIQRFACFRGHFDSGKALVRALSGRFELQLILKFAPWVRI